MREALYYERGAAGWARCVLCPKYCVIKPDDRGFCRVRENRGGILYSNIYARCASYNLDPMEKKPLFHFHPGHTVFSIGTTGCNFACVFCQNWQISQVEADTVELPPGEAVGMALHYKEAGYGCAGIAFTYNEPSIWFEYIMDTASLARERGLKVVMVTNGFICPEPLQDLLTCVDGFNVDVKGFTAGFYTRVCRGLLEPVLETVAAVRQAGRHVEVTNLLIPGENDDEESIGELVDWLAGVGEDIPLHLSRYHPAYKLGLPATDLAVLDRAKEIARRKLRYVYLGNTRRPGDDDTFCHNCGRVIAVREGFRLTRLELEGARCRFCDEPVAGAGWEEAIPRGGRQGVTR